MPRRLLAKDRTHKAWTPRELSALGTMTDKEVAAKLGRTCEAVRMMRVRRSVPARHKTRWTPEYLAALGKIPDRRLAECMDIGAWMVGLKRKELGIGQYRRPNVIAG